jgi:uncharacterized membrane protein
MLEWFSTLSILEQILWVVSIVFTVIFFYQILSTLLKRTAGKYRNSVFAFLFAFKNITAFLSMFGWVSIASIYQGFKFSTSLLIGVFGGIVLMGVMSILFYLVYKIKESIRPEMPKDMNSTGEVVSNVGAKRSSMGKIKIKVDGVQKISEAMTDFEHDVIAGTKIRVESVTSTGIFIIKPLQ